MAAASIIGTVTGCSSDDKANTASSTTGPDNAKTASSAEGSTAAFRGLGDDQSITTKEYVGAVAGSEIYAAFAISRKNSGDALAGGQAYFCDGKSIANWFTLVDKGGKMQFVGSSGDTFDAELADGKITAKVTLGGKSYDVTAANVAANGEAGLYLADHAIEPDLANNERGGWIVLPDGTQRGAIRGGTTVLPGTTLKAGTTNVIVGGRDILLRAISEIIGLDKKD